MTEPIDTDMPKGPEGKMFSGIKNHKDPFVRLGVAREALMSDEERRRKVNSQPNVGGSSVAKESVVVHAASDKGLFNEGLDKGTDQSEMRIKSIKPFRIPEINEPETEKYPTTPDTDVYHPGEK